MLLTSTLPRHLLSALTFAIAPTPAPERAPAWSPAGGGAPVVARAQPSPAIGQWNIEWELGRRVENDDVQIIKAIGVLTVRASGDSLIANIETKRRSDGRPLGAPVVLGGRPGAQGAVFSQVQQLRFNMNGDERTVDARVTWRLVVAGDSLTGEIVRELPSDMMPMGPTSPATITGTRIKG